MLDLKAVETIRDSNPIFQNKVSVFRSVPKFTCCETKPGTVKLKTIPLCPYCKRMEIIQQQE